MLATIITSSYHHAIIMQGGVGLRLRVFDRIMCFANCHFAAHLEAVNRRNADFDHIFRTMSFSRSSNTNAVGMVPYLLLFCFLVYSAYLFWLLYSCGLPWIPFHSSCLICCSNAPWSKCMEILFLALVSSIY